MLTCRQKARILGISETKVTQSYGPAVRKVAAMLRAFPVETMAELSEAMADLDRLDETELQTRAAMLDGRIDRAAVHRG